MSWYRPTSNKQKSITLDAPNINTAKLMTLLSILDGLNGKKTSEMSKEELMVTEMFFRDFAMYNGSPVSQDSNGRYFYKDKNENVYVPTSQVYRRMKFHGWAWSFIQAGLIKTKGSRIVKPKIEIINDANINWLHLSCGIFKATGAPMYDALNSFPDNYLPIRKYQGKRAATHYTNKTTQFDPTERIFKERDNFLASEADASLPVFIEVTTEISKPSSAIDELLQLPWSFIDDDLKIDIVRGLSHPQEFREYFGTEFDLTTLNIPEDAIKDAEYFLRQNDNFRYSK